MKHDRRQELRTNQLSQQLDQLGAYAKKNVVFLAVVLVGLVAVAGGVYWRVYQRQSRVDDGWATLNRAATLVDGGSPISVFESLANEDLDPGLTAEAWLKVGDVAMARNSKPEDSSAGSSAESRSPEEEETDWQARAERAYTEVAARFPDDLTASGKAMILLGVLAENENDSAQARKWYEKVIEDRRFEGTPFLVQASYRLENVERWAEQVIFLEPVATVPLPPPTDKQVSRLSQPTVKLSPAGSTASPALSSAGPVPTLVQPTPDTTAPPEPSVQDAPKAAETPSAADAESPSTPPTVAEQQEPATPADQPAASETETPAPSETPAAEGATTDSAGNEAGG